MSVYERINQVKIKLLYSNSVLPHKAYKSDAGFDVTATSCHYDPSTDSYIYGIGIAIEMPENFVCLAFPRSSNFKTDCYMSNGIGVIDNGYRGEIKFIYKCRTSNIILKVIDSIIEKVFGINTLIKSPKEPPPYEIGDRVGQLLFVPLPMMHLIVSEKLSDSDRGVNGHGSSGK